MLVDDDGLGQRTRPGEGEVRQKSFCENTVADEPDCNRDVAWDIDPESVPDYNCRSDVPVELGPVVVPLAECAVEEIVL